MNVDKINELIKRQSDLRDEDVTNRANQCIQQIIRNKESIVKLEKQNEEFRKELKELNYIPIDPIDIFGL